MCVERHGSDEAAPKPPRPSVPLAASAPHVIVARLLIRLYRLTFSAILGRTCRYLPTCSEFTEEAISRHGLWAGGWMGARRILSCHPWGGSGYDPVPERLPEGWRWWRPWAVR